MEYEYSNAVNPAKEKTFAFLLGAGCEGPGQLGLPTGNTFKRDTIVAHKVVDLIYALNKENGRSIRNGTILSNSNYGVLTQTIVECEIDEFNFSDEELQTINAYLRAFVENNPESASLTKDEKEEIKKKYKALYQREFFDKIKDFSTPTSILEPRVQYFLDNACFYSFVDSLFNHLRRPDKNPNEVNRVIKLYYAAYQSILFGLIDENEYESILKKKVSVTEKRQMLDDLLRKAQHRIIHDARKNNTLYYNQIAEFAKARPHSVSITTTNYTAFAEGLTGISGENMAYVHGRLDLFEDLKTKRVGALTDFSEDDFIFPFIFVQSGVKPIVNGYEIHEFEKAANMIEKSDELIILGYGINSDDEHITNLIRSRLRSDKRVTCVLYNDCKKKRDAIEDELCNHDNILFIDSSEFDALLCSFS